MTSTDESGFLRALQPDSLVHYSQTLTRLCLFLLRIARSPVPSLPAVLDSTLLVHIFQLQLALETGSISVTTNTTVITSLLQQSPPNVHRNQFSLPLLCFIPLFAAKTNGGFSNASDLTQVLAKLQWTIRVMLYTHIMTSLDKGLETTSADQ